jgi:hypothetical protein
MNLLSISSDILPKIIGDWRMTSNKYYNPDTLFDYINGGAELYISYNFKDVISRRYENSLGEEITIELFDMQEAENAYGVFTQQRESESSKILQECQIIMGSIIFWRGQYFVALSNHKETDRVKNGMHLLAATVSENIGGNYEKPEILHLLPPENLVKHSIRFFNHYIWLNAYNFISSENIFQIDTENVAVIAKYNQGQTMPIFLTVQYFSQEVKTTAWRSLSELYRFKSKKTIAIKHLKGEGYAGFFLSDNHIKAVFRAESKTIVEQLLKTT